MNKDFVSRARDILGKAEKVVVFSGAGLSAESGIATFRGTETDALWSRFDPMKLASVAGFIENPGQVIAWYNWRRQKLAAACPNPAHAALAGHPALMQITQNVDDLLERAGVPSAHILHLHGMIGKDRCHAACGAEETISLAAPPALRACNNCGAPMRPAVVWFGEVLPQDVWEQAAAICAASDCLLVIGTSATVYPAYSLVQMAATAGSKIIVINTEAGGPGVRVEVELIGQAGTILPVLLEGLNFGQKSKGSE